MHLARHPIRSGASPGTCGGPICSTGRQATGREAIRRPAFFRSAEGGVVSAPVRPLAGGWSVCGYPGVLPVDWRAVLVPAARRLFQGKIGAANERGRRGLLEFHPFLRATGGAARPADVLPITIEPVGGPAGASSVWSPGFAGAAR